MTAVLSTPLGRFPGSIVGALNIYGRHAEMFAESDQHTAEVVADHAAFLVGNAVVLAGATQLNQQLQQAVASREIIGEAKGIVMERQNCTRDEAFDVLRRASQRENRKLRELAEDLIGRVETRETGSITGKVSPAAHQILEAARRQAGMSFDELWMAYFALGAQPHGPSCGPTSTAREPGRWTTTCWRRRSTRPTSVGAAIIPCPTGKTWPEQIPVGLGGRR